MGCRYYKVLKSGKWRWVKAGTKGARKFCSGKIKGGKHRRKHKR